MEIPIKVMKPRVKRMDSGYTDKIQAYQLSTIELQDLFPISNASNTKFLHYPLHSYLNKGIYLVRCRISQAEL